MSEFVESQKRKRAAVSRALERQRAFIANKRFFRGTLTARVLFDGEYYDVDEHLLALIESGRTPRELELEPVNGLSDDC